MGMTGISGWMWGRSMRAKCGPMSWAGTKEKSKSTVMVGESSNVLHAALVSGLQSMLVAGTSLERRSEGKDINLVIAFVDF
jgi:hypothetical protein